MLFTCISKPLESSHRTRAGILRVIFSPDRDHHSTGTHAGQHFEGATVIKTGKTDVTAHLLWGESLKLIQIGNTMIIFLFNK